VSLLLRSLNGERWRRCFGGYSEALRLRYGRRLAVYRPSVSTAGWDGRDFSGLDRPVLYLSGRTAIKTVLESMGIVAVDASTQLAAMLLREGAVVWQSTMTFRLLLIGVSRRLKNYLRCRCVVKNRLKMLIYNT
jgi:hypothetical protein